MQYAYYGSYYFNLLIFNLISKLHNLEFIFIDEYPDRTGDTVMNQVEPEFLDQIISINQDEFKFKI